MDKREALAIIINSLEIIPKELKEKLTAGIPAMSDELVDSIGAQLAALKAHSLQEQQNAYDNFAKLVDALDFSTN